MPVTRPPMARMAIILAGCLARERPASTFMDEGDNLTFCRKQLSRYSESLSFTHTLIFTFIFTIIELFSIKVKMKASSHMRNVNM